MVVFTFPTFGERSDHAKNEYAGSHGMAIFSAPNGEVFAHHLSLYSKPHDYQIIYKIGVANEVKTFLENNDLVTLLPEIFDLSKLIRGESLSLGSTVFVGHFERGGEQVYKGEVDFLEPVYIRSLAELELTTSAASFEHIWVGEDSHLVVHHIAPKPSFDAVAWLTSTEGVSASSVPSGTVSECKNVRMHPRRDSDIADLLRNCFSADPVYSELKDFQ